MTSTTEVITARSYQHPALDGRRVVRLVGATVGPAEDLSMEFLGFAPAGVAEVGHGERQALGFPAWALVHDPANGRHALALVKEMEKLARVARSKPGNAKDGYTELARRLDAAAPQFLPTFWEEAGRAFLTSENARMAGTCFTEARRAEQVHGLIVDEERVRDVHLEFAFGGGLTATMLAAYSREVVDRRPAPEAYELVKTLALRRVAGGLPPHATMAADLARLAKAAGLDAEREADEAVAQLLGYPATVRSHPGVWKAYRKSLVRLGKRDAAVRARLLEIMPDPPGWDTDIADQWLELLDATGAADDLVAPGGPAARWLERFLSSRRHGNAPGRNARLLTLIERMTPNLIAAGGVTISAQPWNADLDILDLLRAGGVPARLGEGHRGNGFSVDRWVRDTRPGRRDLTAIAADPELRPRLRLGLRQAIGYLRDGDSLTSPALPDQTIRESLGAAGLREVLVDLLGELTGRAGTSAVAGLDADLTELAPLWSAAGMALAPDGFRELLGVDMAGVLARTLRAGLIGELTWPAYEEAVGRLKRYEQGVGWPELVVHDEHSAQVITPDGRVTEHVFRIPATGRGARSGYWSRTGCVAADGELLVSWNAENGQTGYWSSRPDELIDGDWRIYAAVLTMPAPGGGITNGQRPLHPGDPRTGWDENFQLAGDGQAFWRLEMSDPSAPYHERVWQWREFDPRTGDGGRVSAPAFFAAAGEGLLAESSRLRPVPAGFAGSPLGVRDGLAGWRVVRTPEGTLIGEGVDGRRVSVSGTDEVPVGAVLLPGSTTPLPMTRSYIRGNHTLTIWTADGERLLAQQSELTTTVPPLDWWHAMRPRDEAGSLALRELDETTAAAILDIDDDATGTVAVRSAVLANIVRHLTAITDEALRERIAEVAARAVRMRRRIAEIPVHLDEPADAVAAPPEAASDGALEAAWRGLPGFEGTYSGYSGRRSELSHEIVTQVAGVAELLTGRDREPLRLVDTDWTSLLAGPGALALRAASPVTGEEHRQALAAFLATIAGTPLDGETPLRLLALSETADTISNDPVRRAGSQVTVLLPRPHHGRIYGSTYKIPRVGLQVAADGSFTPPAGLTLDTELRPSGRLTGERLARVAALLTERGAAPWRPAAADALAEATGMTRAEAILLLAGLPEIASWEANFLSAEQRATLGLSAAHAKVARAALRGLTLPQRVALLDAAMPADPEALWTDGPDVAAVAEAWIRIRGRRVAVPEDLVAELARVADRDLAASVLQAIAGPAAGDWLNTDDADAGTAFDGRYLSAAAIALPWLAYRLTWDDPLRATLPEALRLVRERLRNPELLVGYGSCEAKNRPEAGPALVDRKANTHWVTFGVAPAKVTGPDDPVLGFIDESSAGGLQILLSGWLDDVLGTPPGASGDPHDPRVSVPKLIAKAAERFGLDEDAAAYYLQVLALPDPTDKAVQQWNGWKPAALRKAQTALTEAGLLVAAKRERAARPVFLPGGWQAAKAPRLPVETWKLPLYVDGGQLLFVPRPLPELFATAWARVADGDVPRYHELREHGR